MSTECSAGNILPGYKKTEAGVIPENWDIYTIQQLIDDNFIIGHLDGNHGEFYPRSHEFKSFGIPYITANDFCGNKVSFKDCKYLSEERARKFRKGVAKNGDVLFAHNATVGPTALLSTTLDYVILSTTATYFRCNPDKLVNSFVLYLLQSPYFVRQYQGIMSQSTRNQVPITAQRKLMVVLPATLAEQKAIAETISDVDALIESLEQLIAKKRQIKQGAMQELLTGKRRLPGFSGEWIDCSLRDCLLANPDYGINAQGVPESGNLPAYLRITDIDDNGRFIPGSHVAVNHPLAMNYLLGRNEIVFARTGASVGKTYLYNIEDGELVFAGFLIRAKIDCEKLCPEFFAAFTKTSRYWDWVRTMSMRSGQPGINGNEYALLDLHLPPTIEEQIAIAAILSDMDAEITALEKKLAKARQIKQGMMQELLTGKIRLL